MAHEISGFKMLGEMPWHRLGRIIRREPRPRNGKSIYRFAFRDGSVRLVRASDVYFAKAYLGLNAWCVRPDGTPCEDVTRLGKKGRY